MIAWLSSVLKPVSDIYVLLLAFRTRLLFEASINGQVFSLQYLLNLEYYDDGTLTTIYITDDTLTSEVYIYNKTELEDETFIYNASESEDETFLYNVSESNMDDFVVHVPVALSFDENYMRSLINKYKIAGTTFRIETY